MGDKHTVVLHDGRTIDSKNFEIHDRPKRRLMLGDKLAIRNAYELLVTAPPNSAVIADRTGVAGYAFGAATEHEACLQAVKDMERRGNKFFLRSMAGTVNFPVRLDDAESLGVDVLFAQERIFSDEKRQGYEERFLEQFIGPHRIAHGEKLEPHDKLEHRIVVQPHWKAKSWE